MQGRGCGRSGSKKGMRVAEVRGGQTLRETGEAGASLREVKMLVRSVTQRAQQLSSASVAETVTVANTFSYPGFRNRTAKSAKEEREVQSPKFKQSPKEPTNPSTPAQRQGLFWLILLLVCLGFEP